jgi:purine-binding chemotaxis protein CheW
LEDLRLAEELEQLVIFRLGKEEFGIEVSFVNSVIRMREITRIPRAPHFLEGVINLRGQITAIIDLRKHFGLESKAYDDKTRILVLEFGDIKVGLIVDAVYEVVRLPKENIEPPPSVLESQLGQHHVKGVGKHDDRLIIIIDVESLLTRKEIESVEKIEETS